MTKHREFELHSSGSQRHARGTDPTWAIWVEQALDDDWYCAYQLFPKLGRTVVGEIRIYPKSGRSKRAGHWAGDELDSAAADYVPTRGLSSSILRKVSVPRALEAAREQATPDPDWLRPIFESSPEFTDTFIAAILEQPRRPGRRGNDDALYALVAKLYSEAYRSGEKRINEAIKARLDEVGKNFSVKSIGGLVSRARGLGFLTPVSRGRPGGALTDRAVKLLESDTGENRAHPGRERHCADG